jgi:predicted DNA-binding protein (UPF0251 family)
MPKSISFAPQNIESDKTIEMTVDEYETIRLIDLEGLTQEECSKQMDVARTTVQLIYISARKKLADCLVNGLALKISGGDVRLCEHNKSNSTLGCGKSCCHRKCYTKQEKGE